MGTKLKLLHTVIVTLFKLLSAVFIVEWLRVSIEFREFMTAISVVAIPFVLGLLFLAYKKITLFINILCICSGYFVFSVLVFPMINGFREVDARYEIFMVNLAEIERLKKEKGLQECDSAIAAEAAKFDDPFSDKNESLKFHSLGCYVYSVGPDGIDNQGFILSIDEIYFGNCESHYWQDYLLGKWMCYSSFEKNADVSLESFSSVWLEYQFKM